MPEMAAQSRLPSETFCMLPWVQLYADTRGRIHPCCLSSGDHEVDEQGRNYLVSDPAGIGKAWNSPSRKEIRRQMIAGQRPATCQVCFGREDRGMRSYRQSANEMFSHRVPEVIEHISQDGEAPPDLIRKIEFYLGNSCNLRCRMCNPTASKAMIKEWAEIHGMSTDDPRLKGLRRLDWFKGEAYWRNIERLLPHAERVHFGGGEPFQIPATLEMLERIVSFGNAGSVTLSFVTNLTVLPKEFLDLLPRFKAVFLVGSLDGFGDVHTFIRQPARWSVIDKNLKALDAGFGENGIRDLSTNTTVQVFNIFRLDELLEYAATSFSHLGRPELSLLYYPAPFSIRILPPAMKQLAATRLRNFAHRFDGRWPARWEGKPLAELLAQIDGIIDHMMSEDRSDLIPEFRRWCLHQDRFRKQKTLDMLPELAPLFDQSPATVDQPTRKSA